MKGPEDVGALFLKKAYQDFDAAKRLATDNSISSEIVGFHIEQRSIIVKV